MIDMHFNGDYSWFVWGVIDLEINYPKTENKGTLMKGLGMMYNINQKFSFGIYLNSKYTYTVTGYKEIATSYDDAFIEISYSERSYGVFAQYKKGIFELEAGPAFQSYKFEYKDFSEDYEYYTFLKPHCKDGLAIGLCTGFQFAVPKRVSMFDYIFGFRYSFFFTKASTPSAKISLNGYNPVIDNVSGT